MTRRLVIWLMLAVGAAGCAPTTMPSMVRVERTTPPPLPADPTDERLLSTVSWALTQRLGLPLSLPVHVHFYGSQVEFERALTAEARSDNALVKDQARYATGVGTANGIHLRGDRLATVPLEVRVALFAHELTHVSQYEMAGGRRATSEQWLREGFADWVQFRTTDLLSIRPYAESRRRMVEVVRRAGPADRFPSLGVLVSNRQWVIARTELGSPATYGQAFLATDWLIERHGSDRVVDYFRRFASVDDRARNFRAAFGQPPGEFAQEFRSRLASLL
jgi:hypothetical protein